jgi:hypothetical protein
MSFDSDFTKHVCDVRGFPQVLENGPERQAAVMYEEDRPALLEMYRKLDAGAETAECQYGFTWEGVPAYRRAKATAIYDEKNTPPHSGLHLDRYYRRAPDAGAL